MSNNYLADLLRGNTETRKLAVWAKGHEIPGKDRASWCRDDHGRTLCYWDYGNRSSEYGWEIDHYPVPISLGGTDDITNLRPLHCATNAYLGGLLGIALGGKGLLGR